MAATKKTTAKKADPKSELLSDLVAGYSKWTERGNHEYAKAYEHMICAFTMKKSEADKTT